MGDCQSLVCQRWCVASYLVVINTTGGHVPRWRQILARSARWIRFPRLPPNNAAVAQNKQRALWRVPNIATSCRRKSCPPHQTQEGDQLYVRCVFSTACKKQPILAGWYKHRSILRPSLLETTSGRPSHSMPRLATRLIWRALG